VENAENQDAKGINFAGFVLSLATTAAVHFGDIPDPSTGQKATPNLLAAGQMIEILGMLQEKTKGNLLEPEAQLIDDLLYELRMRFVQAQEGEKRIIHP
jgi:hypothetical protein